VATPRQREEPPARGRSSERIKGHVFGAGFLALYGAFMLFGALNKGRPLLALVALPLLLLAAVSLYTRHPPRARTGPLWVERVVWLTCTGLRVLISGCLGVFAATLVVVALSAVIGALRGETALLGGAASGFVFALGLGWLTLLVWGFGGWPRLDDWPS